MSTKGPAVKDGKEISMIYFWTSVMQRLSSVLCTHDYGVKNDSDSRLSCCLKLHYQLVGYCAYYLAAERLPTHSNKSKKQQFRLFLRLIRHLFSVLNILNPRVQEFCTFQQQGYSKCFT